MDGLNGRMDIEYEDFVGFSLLKQSSYSGQNVPSWSGELIILASWEKHFTRESKSQSQ